MSNPKQNNTHKKGKTIYFESDIKYVSDTDRDINLESNTLGVTDATDTDTTMAQGKKNKALLENEKKNYKNLEKNPNLYPDLYPTLNDPNFNTKIYQHPEFSDNKYDGAILDVKKRSEELATRGFDEISPHQVFIKNFMSMQTPFNSMLLFHGLGTGKTCSAIGVCEEVRQYLKQIGGYKKIWIIANPNVQDNFRRQLFDENELVKIGGQWTMKRGGCIGEKLLREINPTNIKNIKSNIHREKRK